MTIIRLLISVFLILLIVVATIGWIWVGRHQAAAAAAASRVVLTLCIAAGLAGLGVLWRARTDT
jgi:predicted negative regulator of RcsB-dependent stress response